MVNLMVSLIHTYIGTLIIIHIFSKETFDQRDLILICKVNSLKEQRESDLDFGLSVWNFDYFSLPSVLTLTDFRFYLKSCICATVEIEMV